MGELITQIDSIPTITMNHSELHRILQGPEYTEVSLGIADPQGHAQTITFLICPSKTSQISWARAVKPLRDRRLKLEETISDLTKDEEKRGGLPVARGGCFCETLAQTESTWVQHLQHHSQTGPYHCKARQNGENVNPFGAMASVAGDRSGPWTGWIGPAPV